MIPSEMRLTDRQISLLATEDSDLESQASEFSFDLKEFELRIEEGAQWIQFITGHLYLDHILALTLTEGLVSPNEIETKRLSFSQRLQMCLALGLLEKDLALAIEKVNNLRNRLAHSLSFRLTDSELLALANSTPKRYRSAIKKLNIKEEKGGRLGELVIIIIATEISRQSNAARRLRQEKSEARLIEAMIKAKPTVDRILGGMRKA